ncbi:hypothetical protein QM012_009221 [Aureobasidium pullulans]|uniref:Uncharacterized protein n=1 Tax=Aureobasidium pullulans TaxID=5580 RepID=A0ABR0TGA8_AURPU
MKIPTFFLRTNMRLLIFQAFVAWICIRCHNLPIPSGIGFALTSTLGNYVNTAKDILDSRYGFILPWEATFFLPIVMEEYILDNMPELAILLGTSPCAERVSKKDPMTKLCIPEIAYHCNRYAEMHGKRHAQVSLRIMEACWESQHTDIKTASKHHETCHKHEPVELIQLIGCMKAMEYWEKKKEICGKTAPVMHCIAEFGAYEAVAPLQKKILEKREKEKMSEETTVEADENTDAGKEAEQ